ncbi:hypothetical protein [Peribacillus asahii]|uniref:Uncharacterized protein n=1 Tax=Peribacillus asahii TaxID=228899 RepID=A0A3Q9RNK1_9BACI|nr:hypothetical protein [Peribacillus asahii]AZV43189.1 hypothetical protein BAOM_2580 [Peribacillus asahii]USK83284.1 hypothetical protein LIT35_12330 [Peribacillus asahii]
MKDNIQEKLGEILDSVEIYPEYSSDIIRVKNFTWNKDLVDFIVEYYINGTKCIFRYNDQIAKEYDSIKDNPLEQLEWELTYIKRMYERGSGAKEYHPCTTIEH